MEDHLPKASTTSAAYYPIDKDAVLIPPVHHNSISYSLLPYPSFQRRWRMNLLGIAITMLLFAIWPQTVQAQTIFQETFGSTTVSGTANEPPSLPTTLSTAEGSYADPACLNGLLRASAASISGDSASDGDESTAFLLHYTAVCDYFVNDVVWRNLDPIEVLPNTTYMFSYWIAMANTAAPPELSLAVMPDAGVAITRPVALPGSGAGVWEKRAIVFTTDASASELNLQITNSVTGAGGNDFALDDIRLEELTPPLVTCTDSQIRATQRFWYFGDQGAIDFDISGTTATPFLGPAGSSTLEGSTVVTDQNGQLLFWTNGQTVYDRNGNPMPNGTLLLGSPSATQTVAAFPALNYPGRYFIVTPDDSVDSAPNGTLYYYIVEMSANGGLGDVVGTGIQLGANDTASEALTAVPNADGTGYWVLTYTNGSPNILAYEFNSDGPVTGTPVVSVLPDDFGNWYGSLYFSQDLTRLVALTSVNPSVSDPGMIRLLRFDADSGEVYEEFNWALPTAGGSFGYTADFSPSGDYIYATKIFGQTGLYRYLIAGATSGIEVKATEESLGVISADETGGHVRRGPDGRMYIADRLSAALSVVNMPDDPVDPDFNLLGFPLAVGSLSQFGLPQMVTGCGLLYDFGDAPDSYGTLTASNGAAHAIVDYDSSNNTSPAMLGASIDPENNGQPTTEADGDDIAGVDDEDGVTFNPTLGYSSPLIRTGVDALTLQPLTNTLEIEASTAGFASVWVDWNNDGDFDESDEQIANAMAVTAGINQLPFTHITNTALITTFVRVRFSTDDAAIATPTGVAPDGEVEDYLVVVDRRIRPAVCTTNDVQYTAFTFSEPVELLGNVRYTNVTIVNGVAVDLYVEVIGGNVLSFGIGDGSIIGEDDARWNIASNATLRYTFYEAGTSTPISINAMFTVSDMDGGESAIFSAADIASYAISPDSIVTIEDDGTTLRFNGSGSQSGGPASRFQIVLEDISTFEAQWLGFTNSGFGFDGDGDLAVQPACSDWGDAPDSYGTAATSDGARHVIVPGLLLGTLIDAEEDGQPNANANGDDLNGVDDEDGVTLPAMVTPGELFTVPVQVNGNGYLYAWIDWDGDGSFDLIGELALSTAVATGISSHVLTVPGNAALGTTYARFRLTSVTGIGPTGEASDGEVEDYVLAVGLPSLTATKSVVLAQDADGSGNASPGDTLRYTIVISNSSEATALSTTYSDTPDTNTTLAAGSVTTTRGTITSGNGAGDSVVNVTLGNIPGNSEVTIVYDVVINNPFPVGVAQVRNQGILRGSNFDDTPTDDPTTQETNDATIFTVTAAPRLVAYKQDALLVDSDENSLVSPGDTLVYTITIINSGNTAATGVFFTDTPDPNTQLVPGSVQTSAGSIVTGNVAGDTSLHIDIGEIPGGTQVNINYQVAINLNVAEGVTQISNQGIVHNDNDPSACMDDLQSSNTWQVAAIQCPQIPTDDPETAELGDATVTELSPRDPTAEEPVAQPEQQFNSLFLPLLGQE